MENASMMNEALNKMEETDGPWSVYQVEENDARLSRIKQTISKFEGGGIRKETNLSQMQSIRAQEHSVSAPSGQHSMLPEVWGGSQSVLSLDHTVELEEKSDIWMKLVDLMAALSIHQSEQEEFDPTTLEQAFKLAIAVNNVNHNAEAEDYSRRTLNGCTISNFTAFLQFTNNHEDLQYLKSIATMLVEINQRYGDHGSRGSIGPSFCQMVDIIQRADNAGNHKEVASQLIAHGFLIAHKYANLGLDGQARCMYQHLLEHSSYRLDDDKYQVERAKAYQRYGTLLIREGKANMATEQLLSACELTLEAIWADTYGDNDQFLALLKRNYDEIGPLLQSGPNKIDTLDLKIGTLLNEIERLHCPVVLETSTTRDTFPAEDVLAFSMSLSAREAVHTEHKEQNSSATTNDK